VKNIFYYFTHKIVFSLLFFLILIDGSKALAAHSLINCPCDSGANADVICHDDWFCPSGYEKYKSGGDLLDCESDLCGEPCCDSGERCCFRKNMEGCPEYSTCFAEEPTDLSFKWRDIGKTCVDGDGEDGKCYIPDNN
jgi:hypothetical protein